jgi:hypothetical protein
MTRFISILITLVMAAAFTRVSGQRIEESDPRAMIQANFLYQFAANCNWPAEVRKGKFTIGVLGHPGVFDHLSEKYGTKPIGTQSIEVVELIDISPSAMFHVLFIDKSRKSDLTRAVKETKGKPTLLVTNWEGALQSGAHINFKNVGGNIRYEMNTSSIDEKKIAPGVKILQWKVD